MASWRPILDGETGEQARQAIGAIADAVRDARPESFSLGGGSAGMALLPAYRGAAGDEEVALRLLEHAVTSSFTASPLVAQLYGGVIGVAWAVEHMAADAEGQSANEQIDDLLLEHARAKEFAHYDLIGGLVGLGVYALEGWPRPIAQTLAHRVFEQLDRLSEPAEIGSRWLTPPDLLPEWQRAISPQGHWDLGVAHGVPGIVGFFAELCRLGPNDAARDLLGKAVAWVLSQELPSGTLSRFPDWIQAGREPPPSRSAWCYGDPGVAAVLLAAARTLGDAECERRALEIARHAARRAPATAGVLDASLCHGAAGLAHVFNRIYQATGDEEMLAAARFWFQRTLEMRHPGEGFGGFVSFWMNEGKASSKADPGFLVGSTGIALALLAATTDVEPAWDRVLLLSGLRSTD